MPGLLVVSQIEELPLFVGSIFSIITTDYVLNLEPGKFIAVLDMKAEARNCLRVFFTFEDSRKVMATTQWWQRYGEGDDSFEEEETEQA